MPGPTAIDKDNHQPLGETFTCPPLAALATKKSFCSSSHAMCCSERHSKVFPMAGHRATLAPSSARRRHDATSFCMEFLKECPS